MDASLASVRERSQWFSFLPAAVRGTSKYFAKAGSGKFPDCQTMVHFMEGKTGWRPNASFSNISSQIASPARALARKRNVLSVASQVLA